MTTSAMLAPLVGAVAVLCLPSSVLISPAIKAAGGGRVPGLPPLWRRAVLTGSAITALGVLTGLCPWWAALLLGGVSAAATSRLPLGRTTAEKEVDRHRLAVHGDLLAACLDAGMSVGSALLALARPPDPLPGNTPADPDDPMALLDAVAALLLLGADPERAWQGAQEHPDLAALAGAARRTASGGAAFADAVREHSAALRAVSAAAADRSAGRAGVAITAPLGLCFLPAFLCLGLAPVVVGLLSCLHLF